MNFSLIGARKNVTPIPDRALAYAAVFWFLVAVIGQWLFVYFVVAFYYGPTLQGDFAAWSRNKMLPHGYISGDSLGNLMFAFHVLLAGVMTLGGALQLIAPLRARWPLLHRWTGRTFFVTAIGLAVTGFIMVWFGGRNRNWVSALAISINALLIVGFAVMAWRFARARDFANHQQWALRAFVAASGVWFIRVGYMARLILNQAPVGITRKGDGWFDLFIAFACYLVPLTILELYLRVGARRSSTAKFATSAGLVFATLVMALGICGAFKFFWRPLI